MKERKYYLKCNNILNSDSNSCYELVRDITGRTEKYCKNYYVENRLRLLQKSKERDPIKRRARQRGMRLAVIEYLGKTCVYCGFTDIRVLQLDHIKGKGHEDFRKHKSPDTLYRYYFNNLDKAKENLQVLCANCNWIKKYENGEGFSG